MARLDMGILKIVPMGEITVGERAREKAGDIIGLAKSIEKTGLIHPIAVYSPSGEAPYRLLAGGRRMLALMSLKATEVSVRIFNTEKTDSELAAIELFENIDRKDFEQGEEVKLIKRAHEYMKKNFPKHSMRDTARQLNRSVGSVSMDIDLAEAIDKYPEMGLQNAPNKTVARKILQRARQLVDNQAQIKKHLEELDSPHSLQVSDYTMHFFNAYRVGDFFTECKALKDGNYDLIEVDPPWAIDEGSYFEGVENSSYVEEDKSTYSEFITKLAKECYRLAAKDSWVVWWFGQEWHIEIYSALRAVGFVGTPVPAIWYKIHASDYSRTPYTNLSSNFEPFLYMRKGDAKLASVGRSNVFEYEALHHSKRIHPTERPVELMTTIINTFSFQGAKVLVPFAGSGNTLRACFNINRYPLGFDLSEEFKNSYGVRILSDRNLSGSNKDEQTAVL